MTAADLVGGYSYFTEISPPLVGTWEERGAEGGTAGRTDKVDDGVITKRKGKVDLYRAFIPPRLVQSVSFIDAGQNITYKIQSPDKEKSKGQRLVH